MGQILSLAFMAEKYARSFSPAAATSLSEYQAAQEAQLTYLTARYRQRLALRELFGDDKVDRAIAGGLQIDLCRAAGHFIACWQDIATKDHHWQHGENPEHRLTMPDAALQEWPWADGPVGEWVARVHAARRPAAKRRR